LGIHHGEGQAGGLLVGVLNQCDVAVVELFLLFFLRLQHKVAMIGSTESSTKGFF
jgi:hypothetical protein